ncbi:MAG: DUF4062 domain-containing protein [Candidatus Omnitrophica bacterium]|nr:DUF4062 domain-containing protein [Candidatus Omnitrophota bacterium]
MEKHKIFISSVQKEFKEERVALRDFMTRDPLCRRYFDVFLFEDVTARDRGPDSVFLEEVKKCDVYVCLLGHEYGAAGALPSGMTLKSLRTAHSSLPHNPLISEPLFWALYIERAGTGTLDMIASCRKAGIPEPEFEQRDGQFVLTIRCKTARRSGTPIRSTTQVEAPEAPVEAPVVLAETEKKIIVSLQNQDLARNELLRVLGCSQPTGNFKKAIVRLLQQALIKRTIVDKPNSRLQKYRLTKKGKDILGTQR